jgi:hypothetical protein
MPMRSELFFGSRPWRCHLVGDGEHVARRDHDDLRLEVGDELHLALGHAAAERDHGEPEPLRAVVRAEAAGEQAVAVGVVHLVAGPRAGGAHRARHHVAPGVEILRGVADDGRLAGRARRGMDTHHLFHRHREQAERIGVAQVRLATERKPREVLERAAVGRFHAGGVEFLADVRHAVVGVLQRPAQPLELQFAQLLSRSLLDGFQRKLLHLPLKTGLRFSRNAATPSR